MSSRLCWCPGGTDFGGSGLPRFVLYTVLAGLRAYLADLRDKQDYKLSGADSSPLRPYWSTCSRLPANWRSTAQPNNSPVPSRAPPTKAAQARAAVDASVALHASNETALAGLQRAGEQAKQYIEQGAQAFDKVDEYAEASWDDIRGNGTEAQKAADHAQELWTEATSLNALTPDGPQDFEKASQLIAQANASLEDVRRLLNAILERLKNLEESKRTACRRDRSRAAGHRVGADSSSRSSTLTSRPTPPICLPMPRRSLPKRRPRSPKTSPTGSRR